MQQYTLVDGLAKDGLVDVYNKQAMGNCAELCATEMKITAKNQDAFAINSYKKAADAWAKVVLPLKLYCKVKTKKVDFAEDEEYKNRRSEFRKIPELKPAFAKDGTITSRQRQHYE